jgi:LmbE family N-acetylglucosaminyl deacetylase
MRVLVFGPHPDDVEVGMGGTIAKYAKAGHEVTVVIATIPSNVEIRKKESLEAAKILGAKLEFLDIDPHKINHTRETIGLFDKPIREHSPDIVYTCWNKDSHQDHQVVAKAVISATRKNRGSLYMYEQMIPSGIMPDVFRAQAFVDISNEIDAKMNSVKAHKSQLEHHKDGWLSGIEGRARYRGFQIGATHAEAFEIVREIKIIPPAKCL